MIDKCRTDSLKAKLMFAKSEMCVDIPGPGFKPRGCWYLEGGELSSALHIADAEAPDVIRHVGCGRPEQPTAHGMIFENVYVRLGLQLV